MEAIVLWKGPGPEEGLGSPDLPELQPRELLRAQGLHATQLGLGEKATGVQLTPPALRKWRVWWGASKGLGTSCYPTPRPRQASHWDGIKGLVPLATAGATVFHRVGDGLGVGVGGAVRGRGNRQFVYQHCLRDTFVGSGLGNTGYPKCGRCS